MSPTHFEAEVELLTRPSHAVEYSITHRTLLTVAREHGITPTDVRVLLLCGEHRDRPTFVHDIERLSRLDAHAARKSVRALEVAALVTHANTSPAASPVVITAAGHKIIDGFVRARNQTAER